MQPDLSIFALEQSCSTSVTYTFLCKKLGKVVNPLRFDSSQPLGWLGVFGEAEVAGAL